VLSLLVSFALAAPPTAISAEAMASAGQWDELYLGFAAAAPKGYSAKDAKRIGVALAKGCAALLDADAVLAGSLGEKSVDFFSESKAVVCAAQAALKGQERTAAETLLRTGLKKHPKDGPISLELGRLMIEEKDGKGAVAVLTAVPKKSPAYGEARTLLIAAQAIADEQAAARSALGVVARTTAEASASTTDDPAEPSSSPPTSPMPRGPKAPLTFGTSRSYESGTDEEGRRIRQNAFFRFRYFSAQRDFGQRADYEGRVQAALEEARVAATNFMGVARETPTDVILYSKSEFVLHHGPWAAQNILGFYSQSAIRMNDSAEINPRNQATLVHEYVHAVIDELCSFRTQGLPIWVNEGLAEYTEWQYQGRSRPEGRFDSALRQRASQNNLPKLETMTNNSLVATADPGLSYALSAIAVRTYVQRFGMPDLLGLIRDVGRGTPFEKAFTTHTSTDLTAFEEGLRDEILAK
jgi:hypothetical protein